MNKILAILTFALLWTGSAAAANANCAKFSKSVASGTDAKKLKSFLDVQWKYYMTEYPEWATYVGFPGQDDRWTELSLSAIERRRAEGVCQKDLLAKIKRTALPARDRVTYDLAVRNANLSVEGDKFDQDYMPISHMDGFHIDSTQLLSAMPTTVAGYDNMLKRLESYPVLAESIASVMREGVKRKAMPVKAFMPIISGQLTELTPAKVEDSPFYQVFKEMSPTVPEADRTRLQARAKDVITAKIYPAVIKFKGFFEKEYAPHGRESIAWTDLPNGKAWYAYFVKRHTTTNMNPEQLHDLGLQEVANITAEMQKVIEQVKFKGDLQAFNKFMLKDKQFYYTNKEDLLAGYRDIAKRIDPELPKLFKTLPRMTYGVREIQEFAAKNAAAAQYISGSPAAGRPGYFEANTYDLPSRPKWDMETLTMHEAVPGHHFQIAIAQELGDLPEFRKHGSFTAYVEGWALYAETLGKDMGFYKNPHSYYGHLGGQMLRAVRLVVDTGMHAKGWSKQQAWDYYRSKMPTSDVDSENEINRYITWPGQALAYKVGQLKIRELRDKAQTALGDKFDIREFHDEVLRYGALPMDVLEKTIDEWTAKVKKSPAVRANSTISSR